MRVLIVDDELLVRVGLKTIIPWEENGFQLVGEASNGAEAWAMLEETPCDIVLTDIRMPEENGLELIEKIRRRWPLTKCIILSSYNDFEYVRKALQLGAVDYILKLAMDPDELLEKLVQLKEQIAREKVKTHESDQITYKMKKYAQEAKEKRLKDLLVKQSSAREIRDAFQEFRLEAFRSPVSVVCIGLDQYEKLLEENKLKSETLLNYSCANIWNEIIKRYGTGELVEIDGGIFALITSGLQEEMLEEMRAAAAAYVKVSCTIGVSLPQESIYGIHEAYLQAATALQHRYYAGYGQIIAYESLDYAAPHEANEPINLQEWERVLDKGEPAEALDLARAWINEELNGSQVSPEVSRERWLRLLHHMDQYVRLQGGDLYSIPLHEGCYPYQAVRGLERFSDICSWFFGWIPLVFDYLARLKSMRFRPEIRTVMDVIRQNYREPLKVSELARQVGYTENYLSVLFKKETGETIMDFIARIRMDRARELLKDPRYKIYEISEMVGYPDPNYFSKQFKKMEGLLPLEYRKLQLGRD